MVKHLVVDADGHVMEPNSAWPRYLEARFRDRAPRTEIEPDGYPRLVIDGRKSLKIPRPEGYVEAPKRRLLGGADPKARLRDMDLDGIDVAVLYPTKGLLFGGVQDPELAVALSKAYHDWLWDYCEADRVRLKGVALAPLQDIPAAIREVERGVSQLGMVAVMVRPNPYNGRRLDDPAYDPFWAAAVSLGISVAIHEGTNMNMPTAGADRYDNFFFQHIISHVFEQQLASLTLICGGVLQKHPGLRVGFLEAGTGWLPYWLERMDHHFGKMGWIVPHLKEKPSEFFRRQCFITVDADEEGLAALVHSLGEERLLFASDYPHADAVFPGSVQAVRSRPGVSDAAKRRILGDNAARFYNLSKFP